MVSRDTRVLTPEQKQRKAERQGERRASKPLTPEQRAKKLARQRVWRGANPEKIREYAKRKPAAVNKAACKRWYAKKKASDPEFVARNNAKTREKKAREKLSDPRKALLQAARERARKRGRPCTIGLDDIFVPAVCPYLGCRMKVHDGPNAPSLDEIVHGLGYVPGNVEVVSRRANTMKSDATLPQLVTMAEAVIARFGDKECR